MVRKSGGQCVNDCIRTGDADHWVARPSEVSYVPSRLDAEDQCEGLVSRMWVLISIAT